MCLNDIEISLSFDFFLYYVYEVTMYMMSAEYSKDNLRFKISLFVVVVFFFIFYRNECPASGYAPVKHYF